MGTAWNQEFVAGDMSAQEAFNQLRDRDEYEEGAGIYSGSFANAGAFVKVIPGLFTMEQAEEHADKRLQSMDKRGTAEAVAVQGVTVVKTVDVDVSLPFRASHDDLVAEALSRVKVPAGHVVVARSARDTTVTFGKPKVAVGASTPVRQFFAGQHGPFATQAEARAKAVELCTNPDVSYGRRPHPIDVTCRMVRPDDEPLVRVEPVVKKTTATVPVVIAKPTGKRIGWYVYCCSPC